jgi:hypothetical protein
VESNSSRSSRSDVAGSHAETASKRECDYGQCSQSLSVSVLLIRCRFHSSFFQSGATMSVIRTPAWRSAVPIEISTHLNRRILRHHSHEWVRQRLVRTPEKLFKNGKRYKVPRGVAEEFVRSVFV